MKSFEFILLAIFVVGISLFKIIDLDFLFVFIPGFILSIYYFALSIFLFNTINGSVLKYKSFQEINRIQIVLSIVYGVCFSIFTMSLIFITLAWPGSLFLLLLAIILFIILTIILIKRKQKVENIFYFSILNRIKFSALLSIIIILLRFVF